MKNILLILTALSVAAMAEFSRSAAGVVTDSATGLQWQDDYSDNGGEIPKLSWVDAINYCESLMLDGSGWRLPNIRELNSIVDFSHRNPAIYSEFKYNPYTTGFYWSSTTKKNNMNYAWYISFYSGDRRFSRYDKSYNMYVRCVRSGQ
ncbi:MAG: DUF1566 domain-containing protein [Epsilonproteobacteria bacterium]|nr:DUF1566 domain-containing protein [Campylobacterota bacterium]